MGIVSFFNPVIALLALCLLPMGLIRNHEELLLSFIGKSTGGHWLGWVISVDAVLVLSGAVLTSYVGVTRLAERITLDRIFPNFFLAKNKQCISYRIPICFFVLCVFILLVTQGDLPSLAGVYTFSFLTVMALFGVSNLFLKAKRKRLPRPERAPVLSVIVAIALVVAAFIGNMELNIASFYVFIRYLIPALVFILIMLNRARLLKLLIYTIEYLYSPFRRIVIHSSRKLQHALRKINSQELVLFTKGDKVAMLNRVMMYVEENETTKRLKMVHVTKNKNSSENEALKHDLKVWTEPIRISILNL